jgi:cytochrome c oxidase cbb3-type subunit 3
MKLNRIKTTALFAALCIAIPAAHAQDAIGAGMRELLNDPIFWGFSIAVIFLLIALFALNKALNTVREVTMQRMMQAEAKEDAAQTAAVEEDKGIMHVLTDATPVEREAEIMLDHDYDGIHELDNNLPPWWVWGFYATIGYAAIYLIIFITGDALNTSVEYENEMVAAQEKVEAYLATAANAVDESNVVALSESSALDAGAKIYAENCAACHLADGGGSVGPNLTDEYWIHGGGITNVFSTIKYGVPEKGMIAWKEQLSPVKMQQVASYILTLQGTTPANPKDPEGEIWVEEAVEEIPSEETDAENIEEIQETTTTTATAE